MSVSSSRPHILTSCRISELVFILKADSHKQLLHQYGKATDSIFTFNDFFFQYSYSANCTVNATR